MEEKTKMTLPKTFDTCPACGNPTRLAETVIEQLKDERVLPKEFGGVGQQGLVIQFPLIDQAHPPAILGPHIKIKVLHVYWDICSNCGTMYCTKFDCTDAMAQAQVQENRQMRRASGNNKDTDLSRLFGFPPPSV